MPEGCSFRQVDEKHVSTEVDFMSWSPKMDLIAIANIQGEINLHRLSWQKVWNRGALQDGDRVTSLSWRPDGKVLSVGYHSGQIILCDIEDSNILHSVQLANPITSMSWIERNSKDLQEDSKSEQMPHSSKEEKFLPKLPPFSKSYTAMGKGQSEENYEDLKKLANQKELNILVAGTHNGQVHLFAYGVFPVGVVDLNIDRMEKSGIVTSAYLSHDLYLLSLVVETKKQGTEQQDRHIVSFETTLLSSRHQEIRTLALKFGHILSLMTYLGSTIQQMTEAWEDILMEMDSKLKKFAEDKRKVCGGSVSNDFLRLLMFGMPSDELQQFLLHELTEKGLKKLGHSIETSYSNIQKLVLKHLQSVGQALVYHLSDVRGMAQWYDKYGVLGLTSNTIQQALSMAGSFMLKASELQQVIDGSMKNFKAFFRWLYVVIQRLSGEPIPPELSKMTQQDLNFVAQFLSENFTEESVEGRSGFKLELVGQYLKNENLTDLPDNTGNPWVQFLVENHKVKDSKLLYPCYPEKSLIEMHNMVNSSFEDILQKCASVIGHSFHPVTSHKLFHQPSDEENPFKCRMSQLSKDMNENQYLYTAFTTQHLPCEKCHILRQKSSENSGEVEIVSFVVGKLGCDLAADDSSSSLKCESHKFLDLTFYDKDTLAVLLQEDNEDCVPVLAQLPMSTLEENFIILKDPKDILIDVDMKSIDVGPRIDDLNFRRLENMKASQFAVSGTRNVACVLFSSKRRVRLFMMDAEDEDDDDEIEEADTTLDNSTLQENEQELSVETNQDVSQDLSNDLDMDSSQDENKENASIEIPNVSNIGEMP